MIRNGYYIEQAPGRDRLDGIDGMRSLDPISGALEFGSAIFSRLVPSKDATLAAQAAKDQVTVARQLAAANLNAERRKSQVTALTVIGVGALVLAGIFVFAAVRKKS